MATLLINVCRPAVHRLPASFPVMYHGASKVQSSLRWSSSSAATSTENQSANTSVDPAILAGRELVPRYFHNYRLKVYRAQCKELKKEFGVEAAELKKAKMKQKTVTKTEAEIVQDILAKVEKRKEKNRLGAERQQALTQKIQERKAREQAAKDVNYQKGMQIRARSKLEIVAALSHAAPTWVMPETMESRVEELVDRIFLTGDAQTKI